MRRLPSGAVTFLFTDIEGSTKLLHELGPEAYTEALLQHRQVLREAFARHGGIEVDTQGDAFFIAFPTAPGAVRAAQKAQEALAQGPIRVRMGLHTGTPHLTEEGYVGQDVHKGARIASAGQGGQVLLSKGTREASHVEGTDLGEHRLKDFEGPVWIFQLGSERFPPLKTISNTNLPRPASSFVGNSSMRAYEHSVRSATSTTSCWRPMPLHGRTASSGTSNAAERCTKTSSIGRARSRTRWWWRSSSINWRNSPLMRAGSRTPSRC